MDKIVLYLIGCLICSIAAIRNTYKEGELRLGDILPTIVMIFASWVSIIFYCAYKIICFLDKHKYEDKIVWKRKDKKKNNN